MHSVAAKCFRNAIFKKEIMHTTSLETMNLLTSEKQWKKCDLMSQ